MCGWMAVYLPWSWVVEYYLLPFAFGAAAFCGVVVGEAIQALRDERRRGVRATVAGCVGAFLVLFPLSMANVVTNGAIQLAVDAANRDLVSFVSALPANSLLSVNVPVPGEYVYEIGVHVRDIERRPDIRVEFVGEGNRVKQVGGGGSYVAMPRLRAQILPSVRLGVLETASIAGNEALARALGDRTRLVYKTRRHVHLLIFNLHRPVCALLGGIAERPYCLWRAPFVDTRKFVYGWDVYRVSANATDGVGEADSR